MKFKPGDLVECVEGNEHPEHFISEGSFYVVREHTDSDHVIVQENDALWWPLRFRLAFTKDA